MDFTGNNNNNNETPTEGLVGRPTTRSTARKRVHNDAEARNDESVAESRAGGRDLAVEGLPENDDGGMEDATDMASRREEVMVEEEKQVDGADLLLPKEQELEDVDADQDDGRRSDLSSWTGRILGLTLFVLSVTSSTLCFALSLSGYVMSRVCGMLMDLGERLLPICLMLVLAFVFAFFAGVAPFFLGRIRIWRRCLEDVVLFVVGSVWLGTRFSGHSFFFQRGSQVDSPSCW